MWFLAFFAHRHLDFRIPETESLAKLAGVKGPLRWKKPEGDHEHSPFWYLDLPSEEVAKKVVERSILLKGMFEVSPLGLP
jgi:tRNA (guanine10-N2)-methyltransferase